MIIKGKKKSWPDVATLVLLCACGSIGIMAAQRHSLLAIIIDIATMAIIIVCRFFIDWDYVVEARKRIKKSDSWLFIDFVLSIVHIGCVIMWPENIASFITAVLMIIAMYLALYYRIREINV